MREGLSVANRAVPKQKRNSFLEKKLSKDSVTSTKFSESTEELQNQSSHSSISHSTKKIKELEDPSLSCELKDLNNYVSGKQRSVAYPDKNLNYFQNHTTSLDYSNEQTNPSDSNIITNDLIESASTKTPELKSESLDTLGKNTNDLIVKEEVKQSISSVYLNPSLSTNHYNNNNYNNSSSISQNPYSSSSFKESTNFLAPTYSISEYNSYSSLVHPNLPTSYNQNPTIQPSAHSYFNPPSAIERYAANPVSSYQTNSFHPGNSSSSCIYSSNIPTTTSSFPSPITNTGVVPSTYPNFSMETNNTMDFLNMYSNSDAPKTVMNPNHINMDYSPEKTYNNYELIQNHTMAETSSTKYTNPSGIASYDYGGFPENTTLPTIRNNTNGNFTMKSMNIVDSNPGSIPNTLPQINLDRLLEPRIENSNILQEMKVRNASVEVCKTIESPPDYSRATHSSQVVDKKFVHEGFDTIKIPKYREIEVVEKLVEVPVVHTINKYVNKYEIKQVEKLVKKPINKYIETKIDVPELYYKDKVIEVPELHEIVKIVEKPEIKERVIYKSKIETKIIPKYIEVPVVKIVDKYEEYDDIQEVIKTVHVKKVVDIPNEIIKRVKVPIKKIIEEPNYIPVIKYRDVPIEKIRYVPKVQTIEHVQNIPKIIDVPVPVQIPKIKYIDKPVYINKYVDHYVNVPVCKRIIPVYKEGGKRIIEIPIHKPYIVNHDTIVPKNIDNSMQNGSCSVYTKKLDINSFSPMKQNELYAMVNRNSSQGVNQASTVNHFCPNNHFGSAPVPGMNNGNTNSFIYGNFPNGTMMAGGSNEWKGSQSVQKHITKQTENNCNSVRSNSCARMPTDIPRIYHSNEIMQPNYKLPHIALGSFRAPKEFSSNPLDSSGSMNLKNGKSNHLGMSSSENYNMPTLINPGRMSTPTTSMHPMNSTSSPNWKRMKSYSFSNLPGSFKNPNGSFSNIHNGLMYQNRLASSNNIVGSRSPSVGSIDGISAYAVEYVGELNDKFSKSNRSSAMIHDERRFEGSNYSFTN